MLNRRHKLTPAEERCRFRTKPKQSRKTQIWKQTRAQARGTSWIPAPILVDASQGQLFLPFWPVMVEHPPQSRLQPSGFFSSARPSFQCRLYSCIHLQRHGCVLHNTDPPRNIPSQIHRLPPHLQPHTPLSAGGANLPTIDPMMTASLLATSPPDWGPAYRSGNDSHAPGAPQIRRKRPSPTSHYRPPCDPCLGALFGP